MMRVVRYRGGFYIISEEPLVDQDEYLFVVKGGYVVATPTWGKMKAEMCKLIWSYEPKDSHYSVRRRHHSIVIFTTTDQLLEILLSMDDDLAC